MVAGAHVGSAIHLNAWHLVIDKVFVDAQGKRQRSFRVVCGRCCYRRYIMLPPTTRTPPQPPLKTSSFRFPLRFFGYPDYRVVDIREYPLLIFLVRVVRLILNSNTGNCI
jgi:hypothetical protein